MSTKPRTVEGGEKKRSFGNRRHGWKKEEVSEEQKNAIAMVDVIDLPNSNGIIRYDIEDMLKLRLDNTAMPVLEEPEEEFVCGYQALSELMKERNGGESGKVLDIVAALGTSEYITETPSTIRLDDRVRNLRNIMNQFNLENPELIIQMIANNLEGYINEPEVLHSAIMVIIDKCSNDLLYCDAFVSILKRVINEALHSKERKALMVALLQTCQEKYREVEPDWSSMDEATVEDKKRTYDVQMNGFYRFLGDLCANEVISEQIILRVLVDLSQNYPKNEKQVGYILTIIETIGSYMERELSTKLTIDEIFRSLHLWQEEAMLSEAMIDRIRGVRDLKDAKWVVNNADKATDAVAVDDNDWEKAQIGRKKKKDISSEEAESARQLAATIVFCKNLWMDYVSHFVIEDVTERFVGFDDNEQEIFVYSVIKCLMNRPEVEQRRAAVLFEQLLLRDEIKPDVFINGVQRLLADYPRARKSDKNAVVAFRNLFFLVFLNDRLTIQNIIDGWKNKDRFDGYLAEIVFELLNTLKHINKGKAEACMNDMKLKVDDVLTGGCPMIVAKDILAQHGMQLKGDYIFFA